MTGISITTNNHETYSNVGKTADGKVVVEKKTYNPDNSSISTKFLVPERNVDKFVKESQDFQAKGQKHIFNAAIGGLAGAILAGGLTAKFSKTKSRVGIFLLSTMAAAAAGCITSVAALIAGIGIESAKFGKKIKDLEVSPYKGEPTVQ